MPAPLGDVSGATKAILGVNRNSNNNDIIREIYSYERNRRENMLTISKGNNTPRERNERKRRMGKKQNNRREMD